MMFTQYVIKRSNLLREGCGWKFHIRSYTSLWMNLNLYVLKRWGTLWCTVLSLYHLIVGCYFLDSPSSGEFKIG